MAKYTTLTALFTAIANSLRGKTGSTGKIVADDFPAVIDSLSTGGITPTGTKSITTNGTHDVTSYASASVNVPVPDGYVKPSGTKSITTNGTHDVTNYASATVNVPTGITPSGSKTITENGTHDVTNYASAVVNVASGALNLEYHEVTLPAITGSGNLTSILTGNAFVKAHYSETNFFAALIPKTAVAQGAYRMLGLYHGNLQMGSGINNTYGFYEVLNSAGTGISYAGINYAINGKTYNVGFRADSSGNLQLYTPANRNYAAGTYMLILGCAP